jgi:cytochrome c oxidase subunit 3
MMRIGISEWRRIADYDGPLNVTIDHHDNGSWVSCWIRILVFNQRALEYAGNCQWKCSNSRRLNGKYLHPCQFIIMTNPSECGGRAVRLRIVGSVYVKFKDEEDMEYKSKSSMLNLEFALGALLCLPQLNGYCGDHQYLAGACSHTHPKATCVLLLHAYLPAVRGMRISIVIIHLQTGYQSHRIWLFLISDSFIFGGLMISRINLLGLTRPELVQALGLVVTIVLLISSYFANRAEVSMEYGDRKQFLRSITVTLSLGILFLVGVVGVEWQLAPFGPETNLAGAVFYVMTGFHAFHVLTGVIFLAIVLRNGLRGLYSAEKHWAIEASVVYWHFVDVVWFFSISSLPYRYPWRNRIWRRINDRLYMNRKYSHHFNADIGCSPDFSIQLHLV